MKCFIAGMFFRVSDYKQRSKCCHLLLGAKAINRFALCSSRNINNSCV